MLITMTMHDNANYLLVGVYIQTKKKHKLFFTKPFVRREFADIHNHKKANS